MASCYMVAVGGDVEDRVYLDYDPISYDDNVAARRLSSHATFGGGRVWQDFGIADVDQQIRLRTEWMSGSTLTSFQTLYAALGTPYTWVDHKAGSYTVLFRELKAERIQGYDAYRVEMVLDVVE